MVLHRCNLILCNQANARKAQRTESGNVGAIRIHDDVLLGTRKTNTFDWLFDTMGLN